MKWRVDGKTIIAELELEFDGIDFSAQIKLYDKYNDTVEELSEYLDELESRLGDTVLNDV